MSFFNSGGKGTLNSLMMDEEPIPEESCNTLREQYKDFEDSPNSVKLLADLWEYSRHMGCFSFLCNKLFLFERKQAVDMIPQLVNIYMYRIHDEHGPLHQYFLKRSIDWTEFAVNLSWFVAAELEVASFSDIQNRAQDMIYDIKNAVSTTNIALSPNYSAKYKKDTVKKETDDQIDIDDYVVVDSPKFASPEKSLLAQQYIQQDEFIQNLTTITLDLKKIDVSKRTAELRNMLSALAIPKHVYLPFDSSENIVNIIIEECFTFSTKERVPCLLYVETIKKQDNLDDFLEKVRVKKAEEEAIQDEQEDEKSIAEDKPNTFLYSVKDDFVIVDVKEDSRQPVLKSIFGEAWKDRVNRIRSQSIYGAHPDWNLRSFIVKSNDDLRQELMTMKIFETLDYIWRVKCNLPMCITLYKFIVTGPSSGIIETISDSVSMASLLGKYNNYTSLLDYFITIYGPTTSAEFKEAQNRFTESMAVYSVLTYIFQIKDRHNGNIMIDRSGQICHIDFGFLFQSSPGNFGYESAPFKLTKDFVQLIGGTKVEPEKSQNFKYYRTLTHSLFEAARKHRAAIFKTIKNFMPAALNYPCFGKVGVLRGSIDATIENLKKRLFIKKSEKETEKYVQQLINNSLNNKRTYNYDKYQFFTNKIPYTY
mmetsp:Transcript_8362/g.12373  ORF Transcript_8362/g.12373 Transcript_8362/m.12373 type:complete len:648 (+) Transcript_8362:45-1988(+)